MMNAESIRDLNASLDQLREAMESPDSKAHLNSLINSYTIVKSQRDRAELEATGGKLIHSDMTAHRIMTCSNESLPSLYRALLARVVECEVVMTECAQQEAEIAKRKIMATQERDSVDRMLSKAVDRMEAAEMWSELSEQTLR